MVVHLVEWLDGQVLWVQNLWVPCVLNFNIQSRGYRWFLALCTDSTQNGHNSGDGCFGSTSSGMVRCCGEGSDGPKLLSGKKGGSGHVWCNPLLLLLLPGPLLKYPPVSPYCTDTGYNHFGPKLYDVQTLEDSLKRPKQNLKRTQTYPTVMTLPCMA